MNLLCIDSSARENSVTRLLTRTFIEAWQVQHPHGEVTELDLTDRALPPVTEEWSRAIAIAPTDLTAEQQQILANSDELISFLYQAAEIVIGAPMYNFTISAPLKAWIDQIVRPGKTVQYGPDGPKGLLTGKRVTVLTSRGGSYTNSSTRAHLDYQEPYLRAVLSFIGLTDVTFIHAENQLRRDQAERSRQSAIEAIRNSLSLAG